ncbi:rhodanese-like domain-containing protein [Nocardioides marmoriginsengisoli]|uniref:Rhodanese-like domain-containing protein n=1 Tax=Nocardioides marmoriginsengisoli TaxID=661483 RepID=A0A3N0CFN5_9ACTN|nr:rhodanese-like domain-containing protein [Nocardioides marmoriginsengisoli]RNL62041.1 rhodanese-like domain-containing protein [Nocardioides marmoriginsengisoli]
MNGIPTVTVDQVPDPLPEGLTVLDVREPVEWAHGRIDGALHIPLMELMERVDEVPTESQVLVVCKVGGRSAQATGFLVQSGREAINLDGGMLEWAAAGRAMVSDAGDPMVV